MSVVAIIELSEPSKRDSRSLQGSHAAPVNSSAVPSWQASGKMQSEATELEAEQRFTSELKNIRFAEST
jgi:hypothetical protein